MFVSNKFVTNMFVTGHSVFFDLWVGGGVSTTDGYDKGREIDSPCHFQRIPHPGACGKTPVVPDNHPP